MNFIGEKPIDVSIENLTVILTISNKFILRNLDGYIIENQMLLQEPYDSVDNNAHDVFQKKLNIYDTSSLRQKANIIELFKDKNKFSMIINKIFSRAMKFYYQKAFLLDIIIKNVNIRFEDDKFNYHGKLTFGILAKTITASFSSNGILKKNLLKIENVDVYWEKNPVILIPTDIVLEKLDKSNVIDESYYAYLKTIDFSRKNESIKIISNFSCLINVGIEILNVGNIDFFAKGKEKKIKFYIQAATSDVNLHIDPEFIKKFQNLIEILKSYYIIESIQNFKPMRKPYEKTELVNKF